MGDLIKELRKEANELECDDRDHSTLVALLLNAADNLERLVAELEHSEWLRNRGGQVYARVGDEIV